jgi:5-oxoprolinase (ATP-hydrolysing)
MQTKNGKLVFDYSETSPQSETLTNCYLSTIMFEMFVGYYLLSVFDPFCVVNDDFHELLDFITPESSLLRLVPPAALSCRTPTPSEGRQILSKRSWASEVHHTEP